MDSAFSSRHIQPETLFICFSHLRWNFVVQRPHHLMRRAASTNRVIYFEEPLHQDCAVAWLRTVQDFSGVTIATPVLPHGTADVTGCVAALLDELVRVHALPGLVTWYYTPLALVFSAHLAPDVCVYDCMDELSAFLFAPPEMGYYENALFQCCDVVFTGGRSLFEVKRHCHDRVFCFPSSIDTSHFGRARSYLPDPDDQKELPYPRIGFFGVIDERMDMELVSETAAAMQDVQFVMIGPTAKVDPAALPRAANLHWLGPKNYTALPQYLANWQAGWMPFALNDSTRFISPTKTPEFLAAGLALTSTAVKDVVSPYGSAGIVAIADGQSMTSALRHSLVPRDPAWHFKVDEMLARSSWDSTWQAMQLEINRVNDRNMRDAFPEIQSQPHASAGIRNA